MKTANAMTIRKMIKKNNGRQSSILKAQDFPMCTATSASVTSGVPEGLSVPK
jgi:hypothetical protein